ncbi:phage minor head protein [Pseudobacillus sp. 179-B 2D1 NHS]|uniref:phage head morphogenesis protein n=1 Tax=Pseudobacillus sp. 179-B 2D1 NHS TaxID=3374292 RepID=UPI003879D64E
MNKKQFKEYQRIIKTIKSSSEKQIGKEYLKAMQAIKLELANMFEKYGERGIVRHEVMQKYNRLAVLEKKMIDHINSLTKVQIKYTKNAILDIYKKSYYYQGYVIETLAGFSMYTMINPSVLDSIIFNEMDAIKWDERTKENNKLLIRQLKETLLSGLVQGHSYQKMAKVVSEKMNIGQNKAIRIVQTETHRSSQMANLNSMNHAVSKGVIMKKMWLATLSNKTRDTHRHLDGQIVSVDDPFVSKSGAKAQSPGRFGRAEEDINCRCDMISVFDGIEPSVRKAKNPHAGKNEMIKYQTFTEWEKNLAS